MRKSRPIDPENRELDPIALRRIGRAMAATLVLLVALGCDSSPSESAPPIESSVLFPAINVLDLERAEAFYVEMLGMKVTLRIGGPDDERQEVTLNFSGDMMAGESSLVLNAIASRTEPYTPDTLSRIAFRVKDVDGLVERMREAGHEIVDEPRTIDVNGNSIRLAFVRDPEGTRLELLETISTAP